MLLTCFWLSRSAEAVSLVVGLSALSRSAEAASLVVEFFALSLSAEPSGSAGKRRRGLTKAGLGCQGWEADTQHTLNIHST